MTAIALVLSACAATDDQSCRWDQIALDSVGGCQIGEGSGGDRAAPAPAPDPAPEPETTAAPEPVSVEAEPAPRRSSPPARPAAPPAVTASVQNQPAPEPEPEPEEPEAEKPQYSDWSHPGDEENFKGYPPDVVAEKKMNLAVARAAADAAHKAEHAGGANR